MGYKDLFSAFGLEKWCSLADGKDSQIVSLSQLLLKSKGGVVAEKPWWDIAFPSLDELHKSCPAIWQTRDLTLGLEKGFLSIKAYLKAVLDPLTQPLSWMLDGALYLFTTMPWWLLVSLLLLIVAKLSRSVAITSFVGISFLFLLFIDHYTYSNTNVVNYFCMYID